jgi:phage gpG-like protein
MADGNKSFAEIYFESEQWDQILSRLKKKYQQIENRKEFGGIISSAVFENVMDHFDKEVGSSGPWPSWSKSYEDHLKKIGRSGNKKLQFSGKLRQSFTPKNWRAKPEGILFYNNAKVKGSGFPYAAAHDEGGKQLPQREFMWLSAVGIKKLVDLTLKWLDE